MGKKLKDIPNFSSWEEEDEFWSTHSVTELDLEEDNTPLVVEPGAFRQMVDRLEVALSPREISIRSSAKRQPPVRKPSVKRKPSALYGREKLTEDFLSL